MAKYAKDINKQIKIVDVQKQFPGGLKTVDTDDALGRVYLREAENVSLSEFSFLEKRYGLSQQEEFNFLQQFPNAQRIQGYFEYTKKDGGIDKIIFVDGDVFIKTSNQSAYSKVDFFLSEFGKGFNYPPESDLAEVFTVDFYQAEDGPMALPGILIVEDDVNVLEIAIVNRDFQDAILQYQINDGTLIETDVLEYKEQFVIPNVPVPTAGNPVEVKVIAKDPNELRDDSDELVQVFTEYRLITATFDVDGGTPTPDPVTLGSSGSVFIEDPSIETAITKEGYVLVGWVPTLPRSISENTTFTAQWSLGEFIIQFVSNGGSFVEPQTYFFGATTVAPTPPTLEDRDFDGWYIDTNFTTEFEFGNPMPDENITLYAKWANRTATPTLYQPYIEDGRVKFEVENNDVSTVTITFEWYEAETPPEQGGSVFSYSIPNVGPEQIANSFTVWNGIILCGNEGRVVIQNVKAQAAGKDPSLPAANPVTVIKPC